MTIPYPRPLSLWGYRQPEDPTVLPVFWGQKITGPRHMLPYDPYAWFTVAELLGEPASGD